MMRLTKLLLVTATLVLAFTALGAFEHHGQMLPGGFAPFAYADGATGNETNATNGTDDDTNGSFDDDDVLFDDDDSAPAGDDDSASAGDNDGDDDYTVGDDDTGSPQNENSAKDGGSPIGTSFFKSPVFIGATLFLVAGFIILIVIALAYTKMKHDELLNHAMRKKIYDHIVKHEGQHFRNIMTDLDMPSGVLTHHINMLEREEYIKSVQDGIYRRFYTYAAQKDPRHLLTQHQQNILKAIQAQPGISQTDVANQLGLTRMLVNYHLKILSAEHLVRIENKGRTSACYAMGENT